MATRRTPIGEDCEVIIAEDDFMVPDMFILSLTARKEKVKVAVVMSLEDEQKLCDLLRTRETIRVNKAMLSN